VTYKVITAWSSHDLEDLVSKALAAGWILQGGVSFVTYETGDGEGCYLWAQAVTK